MARELKRQLGISEEELSHKEQAAIGVRLAAEQYEATLRLSEDDQERDNLRRQLIELEDARRKAESELSAIPIRSLYTIDHPPLLEDAMTNAQQRLLIISPWIRGDVVDADFLAKLERLLRGGVTIYIGLESRSSRPKTLIPGVKPPKSILVLLRGKTPRSDSRD